MKAVLTNHFNFLSFPHYTQLHTLAERSPPHQHSHSISPFLHSPSLSPSLSPYICLSSPPVHITIRSLILQSWCTAVIRVYIRSYTFLLNRQCKQPTAKPSPPTITLVRSPNIRYIVVQRLSNNSPSSSPLYLLTCTSLIIPVNMYRSFIRVYREDFRRKWAPKQV